jgi:predicted nucleic acid-binding protein
MIVVSDISCISNLLLIGRLDLLQKIYTKIFIPPAIYKEITALEKEGKDLSYFKSEAWIIADNNFTKNISLYSPKFIDAGEAEAIDLALHLKADRLLIDERKQTAFANRLWLITIGLLGVLIIGKQNDFIPSVKELMDKLIKNKFWISSPLYNQVLIIANEQ